MVTLEHRLRMLKIPVLEDGIINLGETSLILRTVRPYVGKGDAEADELMALLLQVRADGIITPDESERIIEIWDEITVERPKRRRMEQAIAAGERRYLGRDGNGQALPFRG